MAEQRARGRRSGYPYCERNDTAEVLRSSDGIVTVRFGRARSVAPEDAEELVALFRAACDERRRPLVVDARSLRTPHLAVSHFARRTEVTKLASPLILLVRGPVNRARTGLALRLARVPCNTRIFASEESARAWVMGYDAR